MLNPYSTKSSFTQYSLLWSPRAEKQDNQSHYIYQLSSKSTFIQTGVSSKDVTISQHVSARLYLPKNTINITQKHPILVYYHGGALVLGSAFFNAYQRYLNILVSESNAIAISVEYRLAPEHDVPTIYEDCWTALQWVASHASEFFTSANEDPWLKNYGDFGRLSIIGDSAGGNIVYHMAMRAGREGGINENVAINGSILVCPYLLVPLEKY